MVSFPPAPVARWLLACMALVIAPHFLHLPLWLDGAVVTALAWRWAAAEGRLSLPGKWMLVLLLAASGAAILLQYHTLFGRNAGVAWLTLMLALKLLEMRVYRDAMLAVFLGYFLAITHFFFSQSIPLAVYLFTVVLALSCALVILNHPASAQNWRRPLKLSALLVAQATPVMLLMFVLFPRLAGPLWGMPGDAFAGSTGLSETMAPGSISRLVQSDAVAFRAEFAGARPSSESLYWHALVLDNYDGRTWTHGRGNDNGKPDIETAGAPLAYTLTIEPHDKNWLYSLEVPDPHALPPNTRLTTDMQLLTGQPLHNRTRFALVSFPSHQIDRNADAAQLRSALQLPVRGNPKARAFALRIRSEATSDADAVARVLQFFRAQPFIYTLTPPLLGTDGIDEFLFETRRGFCEHYAGAFTFLMRAAGVPARVVTGYQGGEFNPLGNYLVVRQYDAHAWSEVWLKGRGWVRVDPTATVAPERIENGIAFALPAGEPLPFLLRTDLQWLKALRLRWDAINNQWNQWVLNFDQERQIGLFASLGFGIVSWQQLAWGMLVGIGVLFGIVAAFTLRPRKRPAPDRVQALYLKFCARLEKIGLARLPTEGPADFAKRVRAKRPEYADAAESVVHLYIQLRYGGQVSNAMLKELRERVKNFRP